MAATTREAWSDSDSLERDLEEGGSGRHHPVTDEEVAQKDAKSMANQDLLVEKIQSLIQSLEEADRNDWQRGHR